MQSPQPMHNVFITTSFSQRLSQNVFSTTFFSLRLSHNVYLTPLPLHIRPNNVILTTSWYTRNLSVLYKYPKIFPSSDPRNFDFFYRSKLNLDDAHLQYIFCHCMKFQNTKTQRTKVSYQSAADKVLYEYTKICQICLSSDPRNFNSLWSIKMKPRRCTSVVYILSLCEVSKP